MRANRRRDTGPELRIRRALHARGFRFRVDHPLEFDRRRHADIAFTRQRVAVFIDGCFWHGCELHFVAPKQNAEFWRSKIESNRARDADTDAKLAELDWLPLRFWEHQPTPEVVDQIALAVRSRQR